MPDSVRFAATFIAVLLVGCGPPAGTGHAEEPAVGGGTVVRVVEGPFVPGPVTDVALQPHFAKEIMVFGVPIVGTEALADRKIVHAAHVMAQYLDNDEDGAVDDPAVVAAMVRQNALLVMFADFDELENSSLVADRELMSTYFLQDLEGHETHPPGDALAGDAGDRFDGAIEEVWHLVSFAGYAGAYPDDFGPQPGSRLSGAMDRARGGQFHEIPETYPNNAWYSYYDQTCDYECMAIEYVYWALSTHLGAQAAVEGRCEWIAPEWRPCTPEQLASADPAVVALLTDPRFAVPTRLPDGSYEVGPAE
jgi:hypothetical protein